MASLLSPHCTCAAYWRGRGARPRCPLHEAEDRPGDDLEPGQARRTDGQVCDVMRTLAGRPGPEADPEGMGTARSWKAWP